MNRRIAFLLLVYLVALSIVYGCSGVALCTHANQSIDAVPPKPTTITEDHPNLIPFYPKPNWHILGDPIDNPRPK